MSDKKTILYGEGKNDYSVYVKEKDRDMREYERDHKDQVLKKDLGKIKK